MNELIVMNDGVPCLVPEISAQIAEFETSIKTLEKQRDELKKAILDAMEGAGILKIDNDDVTINYIAPCDSESFDKKAFKKDHPDLHDQYVSMKPRAAYIKIAVKGE